MRKGRSKIDAHLHRKVLIQRAILVLAAVVLLFFTNYGYGITQKRIAALRDGSITKVIVSRITSRGTYFVSMGEEELDAGNNIPNRSVKIGDSISVYYKRDVRYVVPVGVSSYLPMTILQYMLFCLAPLLASIAIFYPDDKIAKYIKNQK